MSPISIVPAGAAQHSPIHGLLLESFAPSTYEAGLVDKLRQKGRTLLEWVALEQGRVVGYLAYTIAYRERAQIGFHLGPLAICPTRQRQGIASRLVLESLDSPTLRDQTVFVLGDPAYYRRLGFVSISSPRCPYDAGNQHFLVRNLHGDTDFIVGYEAEFGGG